MVTLRGLIRGDSEKLQRQLALKKSALAGILGNQVIRDIAIIGRDAFVQEGAAVGILFQARNNLLELDLKKQRTAALDREKENGCTTAPKLDVFLRLVCKMHGNVPVAVRMVFKSGCY